MTTWYRNKVLLYDAKPKNASPSYFPIARDSESSPNVGAKEYTWTTDVAKFAEDANTSIVSNHLYEVVPDAQSYPCFLYFDLDRQITPQELDDIPPFDDILDAFISVTQRFLKEVYNLDISLKIGDNTQISCSASLYKYSAHVRINVKCINAATVGIFAEQLIEYILSNVHTNYHERNLLTYTKTKKDSSSMVAIVDLAVYKNFRCFRMLYSSKKIPGGTALLPYKNSSTLIKDHVILCYSATNIPLNLPEILTCPNFVPKTDYTNLHQTVLHPLPTPKNPIKNIRPEHQINTQIPPSHLESVEKAIHNTPDVLTLLKIPRIQFNYNCYSTPNTYNFGVEKSLNHYCPYAKRIHSNNRSYFQYNYATRILTYRCFSPNCQENHDIRYHADHALDSLSRLADMSNANTLHCKEKIISWNAVYNLPNMLPYPLLPLIIVRANMGTGKTKILIEDYIPSHAAHPDTTVLFITYQRLLAKKYSKELANWNFTNYLDHEDSPTVPGKKVVICLDSLRKLEQQSFDFIILDEATSVLLHFNSKYINDKSALICKDLKCLLIEAHRIILLDATSDNTIVYEVANYIALHKQIRPYYIKNTYIRRSNRKATIIRNTNKSREMIMKSNAIDHIIELLRKNKNVVVASSTRKFVEQVEIEIQRIFGTKKNILTYHSGTTTCDNNNEDTTNTDKWTTANALLYSPSIAAGVSFEIPHFHQLVAYIDNSFYSPPIDTVLQQLFRVRQLLDGTMTIYANDSMNLDEGNYPITSYAVDECLEQDLRRHFVKQFNFDGSDAYRGMGRYDESNFSYKILKGIIINRNKSLLGFTNILSNTLTTDYDIPTTVELFSEYTPNDILRAMQLAERIKHQKSKEYEDFSQMLLISPFEYETIENKRKRGDYISSREKQQQWIHTCACNLWGVPIDKIDKAFYDTYIGPPTDANMKAKYDKFYATLRYKDYLESNIENHKLRFTEKMADIFQVDEHSIQLYKTKVKEFYSMLIEGHKLMQAIFPNNITTLQNESFYSSAKSYFQKMSNEEYEKIVHLYDSENSYLDKNKLKKSLTVTSLVKRIVEMTFDIRLESNNDSRQRSKQLINSYPDLVATYAPRSLNTNVKPSGYFVNYDEYDPIDGTSENV